MNLQPNSRFPSHALFTLLNVLMMIPFFTEPGFSFAQSYREVGNQSLNDTFEKLLHDSERGNFDAVEKTFQQISQLDRYLEEKYALNTGQAIKNAIDRKDGEKALEAIQRLIYSDMREELQAGINSVHLSKEKSIRIFKYAYLDYLLLSPYIQSKSFSGEQKIRNLFRKFAVSVNRPDELEKLNVQIETEMISSYPALKANPDN